VNQIKPQLPKGMRDFLPPDMIRRQYVMDIVAEVFQLYGYEPFQTPVMELHETLMGKYGEDAERLIFNAQHPEGKEKLTLRYDLTVPLARAFGMHEQELLLPFKRYQIAPVWRAERPARGRFREFYQCDADIIGVQGMEADAEAVSLVVTALERLGFREFRVKLNNRKLLTGIGQYAGLSGESLNSLYRSIDKYDKIGVEGIQKEMLAGGIAQGIVEQITHLLFAAPTRAIVDYSAEHEKLRTMQGTLGHIPEADEGLRELGQVLDYLEAMRVEARFIEVDFAMVRGLGYYTGPIFETVLLSDDPEERVGSVSGGGRYDNLIGLFRKESLPTVGVSLGIERLITLMDKREMYPDTLQRTVVQALVTVFGAETRAAAVSLVAALRQRGVKSELFMQDAKLGKQIGYADKKGIPLVAILGPEEIAGGQVKLKRLADQHEVTVPVAQAAEAALSLLSGKSTTN
jgi:histidyl-tRNA synthetase